MTSQSTVPLDRAMLQAASLPDAGDATSPLQPVLPGQRPGGTRPARDHLRAVDPRPATRSRRKPSTLAGGLTAVCIVLGILAVQLGLSILVSRGAYESRALEVEQRDLIRVERVLAQNLDKISSPQNLAENAAALGMVQNATPATLRLSDSSISGDLTPRTSAVAANLIANATLTDLPVLDADGLLVARDQAKAAAPAEQSTVAPVPWEGKLPAPNTH